VVAAILGHSSIITTTKFYVKTNPQTVIDAVKDLPVPGEKKNGQTLPTSDR